LFPLRWIRTLKVSQPTDATLILQEFVSNQRTRCGRLGRYTSEHILRYIYSDGFWRSDGRSLPEGGGKHR